MSTSRDLPAEISDEPVDVVVTSGSITGTFTPSGLTIGGRITVVSINSTTWTALPATPLANRNAVAIQNESGGLVKVNYDSAAVGFVGMTIFDDGERQYDITDDILIYAKSASGTVNVTVEEIA